MNSKSLLNAAFSVLNSGAGQTEWNAVRHYVKKKLPEEAK